MSLKSIIKSIFIHDDPDDGVGKREVPVGEFKHGDEIQGMADKTEKMVEIVYHDGSKRLLHPKDIFIDKVAKRFAEINW